MDATWPWWRHQMETFSALLAICVGNSPVTGEFPAQRPVTRSYDVSFDLWLDKRLSKQSWGWWIETPSHPLWWHCNAQQRSANTKRLCDYWELVNCGRYCKWLSTRLRYLPSALAMEIPVLCQVRILCHHVNRGGIMICHYLLSKYELYAPYLCWRSRRQD